MFLSPSYSHQLSLPDSPGSLNIHSDMKSCTMDCFVIFKGVAFLYAQKISKEVNPEPLHADLLNCGIQYQALDICCVSCVMLPIILLHRSCSNCVQTNLPDIGTSSLQCFRSCNLSCFFVLLLFVIKLSVRRYIFQYTSTLHHQCFLIFLWKA